MRIGMGQLAACVQGGNPSAGTYSDINCPNSCYVAGNVLDMMFLGQQCWPCHNVCPSGYCWDTTALQCSANPTGQNTAVPPTIDDTPPPAPIPPPDCTSAWNQLFAAQCGGSSTPLYIGGAIVAALLAIVVVNKL
jgi:hypothetical protein